MTHTEQQEDRSTAISVVRSWVIVSILILAAVLSFVDRQILSLLVSPIKADLGLNDIQIGLLQGFAFAMFYSIAAVPLGWLADRSSRKWIVSIGVAAWSLMTAACGLAQNFTQLFLARMGVGVGEATLSASGHSMIADLFDKDRLPLAMSLYGIGVSLGAGFAYIAGGMIVDMMAAAPAIHLAGQTLSAWQSVFIIVGIPGLLVSVLIATIVREPKRRNVLEAKHGKVTLHGFASQHKLLITQFILGIGFMTASGYANLAWLPSFFERTFGWSSTHAGMTIGLLLLFASLPGGVLSGYLASRWSRKGVVDVSMRFMGWITIAMAPILAIAFLLPDATWVVVAMILPFAFGTAYVGLGPAAAQAITPGQLRGRVAAFQLLLTSLIGMVAGPLIVGVLTEMVFKDGSKISYALALTGPVLSLIGGVLLLWALPAYRAALADTAKASDR